MVVQKRLNKGPYKPAGETLDVKGLGAEWDGCEEIRSRLRDGGSLLHPESLESEDVRTCCLNAPLIIPILTRMSTLDGKSLPPVEPMREELEALFKSNKRGGSPEDSQDIIKGGWRIKKLCGFVKMKARREEVSTVSRSKVSSQLLYLLFAVFVCKNVGSSKCCELFVLSMAHITIA